LATASAGATPVRGQPAIEAGVQSDADAARPQCGQHVHRALDRADRVRRVSGAQSRLEPFVGALDAQRMPGPVRQQPGQRQPLRSAAHGVNLRRRQGDPLGGHGGGKGQRHGVVGLHRRADQVEDDQARLAHRPSARHVAQRREASHSAAGAG
jgi:hypothetical protein